MEAKQRQRWYSAILHDYHVYQGIWDRDAGTYREGFSQLGMDAKLVALGRAGTDSHLPLELGTLDQLSDRHWWERFGLDGVLLYSWALPKFEPVARAIKESGIRLVINLDTDGIRIPQVWPRRYLQVSHGYYRMRSRGLAWPLAVLKTAAGWPRFRHEGTLRHLAHADALAIQAPLGKQRYREFLLRCGRPDIAEKLRLIHHPVPREMVYSAEVTKKPLVVAVGGWNALIKGAPLLVKTVGQTLRIEPDYEAEIIGSGEDRIRRLVQDLPAEVRPRIRVLGPVPNKKLHAHYQQAQIILNTSYSEGFSLAIAEALCCGCSVVGLAMMSSINYCCSASSGTMAYDRSVRHYRYALSAEMDAWRSGQRDPRFISDVWTARCHTDKVAQAVVNLAQT